MKQLVQDAPRFVEDDAVVRVGPVANFFRATGIVIELEIRKLRHDSTELLTRAIQPFLWLVLFGQTFSRVRGIPTGHLRYLDFMAPGVLAQSVLFVAIFYGIQAIMERDQGVIVKFLVSPVPRSALVLGKALSAGVRGVSQCVIIYALAFFLHVHLSWRPLDILGVLVTVVLGASLFSTFSLLIACVVKTQQRVMGIGQIITMPLFFASNAIYPINIMPPWMQVISRLNPLTYEVDALRSMMLTGVPSHYGAGIDLVVLTAVTALFVAWGGKLYPTIVT